MTLRYAHSPLARALAGVALAASIITGSGLASAVTCPFTFPTINKTCQQGNSKATVTHVLTTALPVKFNLNVNMTGGQNGAVAYGIDATGAVLSTCTKTAVDVNPGSGQTGSFSCVSLYNTPGTTKANIFYDHGQNMASTSVTVL